MRGDKAWEFDVVGVQEGDEFAIQAVEHLEPSAHLLMIAVEKDRGSRGLPSMWRAMTSRLLSLEALWTTRHSKCGWSWRRIESIAAPV